MHGGLATMLAFHLLILSYFLQASKTNKSVSKKKKKKKCRIGAG